jgi:hypothetical protein
LATQPEPGLNRCSWLVLPPERLFCGLSANSQVAKLASPLIIQWRQTAIIIVELTDSQLLIPKKQTVTITQKISKLGRLKCSLAAFSLQF